MQRVLIVPEQLVKLKAGAELFARSDMRFRSTKNGKSALSVASVWRPDLVIVSNTIADVPLRSLIKSLRETHPDVRVLVLTELLDEAQDDLEADANLIEPVEDKVLLEAVSVLLSIGVRRERRITLNIPAQIRDSQGSRQMANVLNLSSGGCLMEMCEPMEPGDEGKMTFWLPTVAEPIETGFEVRALIDEFQLHYGVEFKSMNQRVRALLDGFIKGQGENP
jgi:DNA-binding NarL/FixJ family response regulator